MHHHLKMRMLALTGIVLVALAACAPGGAGTTSGSGTPVNSPTGITTAGPPVGTGTPPPGAVTLVLNQPSYRQGETIQVTIANGLKSMIFAADHHSNCTLVQLQHQSGGTWQTVAPCRLEIVTRIVSLAASSSVLQILIPASTSQSAGNSWPAGTYRIAFAYGLGSEEALTTQTLVYSATFVIS